MRKARQVSYQKIQLKIKIKKPVLALGSQFKNRLCFIEGNSALLSPVHPDMSNPDDFAAFEKEIKYFLKKNPKIIACDLHPEYAPTKLAYRLSTMNYELSTIQHHHAHIAGCMAENGLKDKKVIGVAFDGTGLGPDNKLWGAEFLICDYKRSIRAAHLKEIPLLGGERAILEPWRVLSVWLDLAKLPFPKSIDRSKWGLLRKMQAKGINSPMCSSMGRFFDAVGCLILGKDKADYEAELAIKLEELASRNVQREQRTPDALFHSGRDSDRAESERREENRVQSYKFKVSSKKGLYIIDPLPIFKEIVKDSKSGISKEKIAFKFHQTIAEMVRRTCLLIRKDTGIKAVVLSGGCFQNSLLLRLSLDLLYKEGFTVFRHQKLSPNDSGISLGQAIVAGVIN